MTDILITDAMIVTMDADRRVIEKGAAAARETEIMIERSGLAARLETPEGFWRAARYPDR